MKRVIIFLAAISLTMSLFASNPETNESENIVKSQITGKVKSLKGLSGLLLAQVVIYGEESDLVKVITTDKNGNYVVNDLPLGNYFITVSYLGYKSTIVSDIKVEEANTVVKVKGIFLEREYYKIAEVVVKAGRIDSQSLVATK